MNSSSASGSEQKKAGVADEVDGGNSRFSMLSDCREHRPFVARRMDAIGISL